MVATTEIIAKKRRRQELSAGEIEAVVAGFLRGDVSEGQMGALLMAILLNGMTAQECADLTRAMLNSGERLDLSHLPGTKVDKHSTGGVGDKTTLVVAPLVAAFGVPVPKMSGRALGHTGGTIDKLEAIPNLTTALSPERFCRQVAEIGVAIAAQTAQMVPADKKIYALRDATATVESIPLIASSIMSKKLAVGADAILLDVKVGPGAFLPEADRAEELARTMVDIGARTGHRTVALVTRMDQPLGRAVGDAVELAEAIATLQGGGPADFSELCEIVAGHMLALGGAADNPDDGRAAARQGLASGKGLPKLQELIASQGGSADVVNHPEALTQGAERLPVVLPQAGRITAIDSRQLGLAVRDLKREAGGHSHSCGVLIHAKVGEEVAEQPAATVLVPAGMAAIAQPIIERVREAFRVGDSVPPKQSLLLSVIGS